MIRVIALDRLGGILGDLRILARLSQRQLATDAGLRQGQISAYELSKLAPTVPSLIRLAHALGYDLALVPREDTP